MNLLWSPVVFVDIVGSVTVLVISFWCVYLARQLANEKPNDVFRNYLFLFTVAIAFFAVSRSFGHLVKQILLLNDLGYVWKQISPFSGAVNSTTFVVIFAFGIYFRRFQKVHQEIEYYKNNLEEMIAQRTDELEKSKNVLENILNNSNPINITDINFDLVRANDAYFSYWPAVGKGETIKCYDSRPGEHCHTDNCPLMLIVEGQNEVVQEVTKDIDGEIKDFIVTARPFRDLDGTLIGMVESFQDITLRKRAERVLVQMDRMKSEFISTAAHELNTPLSSMMGYAEILRDPDVFGAFTEAQKKDFISEIYENGEALSRIIEDLLDISRIESGKPIPLVLQETNLTETLQKKISSFKARCPECDLTLNIPENPGQAVVKIDRHRINQAIENLLSNAEKYSENEIVMTALEKDDHWEIRVEDHGVGMTPEQLSRVFDKFYRADASNTAISGLGLGMSIVKQVIDAHGGKIWVESVPGEGTTAFFTLPFDVEGCLSRKSDQKTRSQMV